MSKTKVSAFMASILLAWFLVATQNIMLLIVPIYITTWAVFPLNHSSTWSVGRTRLAYVTTGFAFGILTEVLAIIDNLRLPPKSRNIFWPYDPRIDLILAIAYYLPLTLASYAFLSKYRSSTKMTFAAGGIYGIITEQSFQILLSLNPIYWTYVFIVYGAFITCPFVILRPHLQQPHLKFIGKKTIPAFTVYLLIGYAITATTIFPITWVLLGL